MMTAAIVTVFAGEVRPQPARSLAFVQAPSTDAQAVGGRIANTILTGRYLKGMRVILADADGGHRTVVSEGFVCATDPSFDITGERLLFAGKRAPGDRLQLWEYARGAETPRRVLECDADCISPIYLPSGHIVFASLLSGEFEEHGGRYSFSLYDLDPAAGDVVRITFNPSSEFDPTLLLDGRLLFSSWQHVGNHHWPTGNVALMLTNWDGTGLFPLTGNHRSPWFKRAPVQLSQDAIAFVQSDATAEFDAGALMLTNLNDAFGEYRELLPAGEWLVADAGALPDGRILVSARRSSQSESTFGLYRVDGTRVTGLYDDDAWHELAPSVHSPAQKPDTRFSTVVPGTPYGYVLVLNVFETDRPGFPQLSGDNVAAVRVVEGMPLVDDGSGAPEFLPGPGGEAEPMVSRSSATGYIPSRILGEVPLARDGSVYLKVPADRPLRLQLLDPKGFTIANERAWFWVRPNERRVCIGCHEDRELAPANATPLAAGHVPTDLTAPDDWETVTFSDDIRPIVAANCAVTECHLPPRPTAGMNLKADEFCDRDAPLADRFGPPYANLLARQQDKPFGVGGRRVHPGDARQSPLLWMLYGRVLGAQYAPAPFDRPISESHPGPMLPGEYLAAIRRWIDLGAVYEASQSTPGWPREAQSVTTEARGTQGGGAQ